MSQTKVKSGLISDQSITAAKLDVTGNGNNGELLASAGDGSFVWTSGIATELYTDNAIAALVDSAPGTLDTLNELAAALGDDANFAGTVTTALATKVDGTGTANYISKWSDSDTLTNSVIYDNGTNVGFGTSSPNSYAGYTTLTLNGTTGGFLDFESNGTRVGSLLFNNASGVLKTQTAIPLLFATTEVERMRIDSSGNVGIGQSSPNNEANRVSLELNDTWGGVFQNSVSGTPKSEWRWSTSGFTTFGSVANEPLAFISNATERMRITSGGDVLIGTTVGNLGDYAGFDFNASGNLLINSKNGNSALDLNQTFDDTSTRGAIRFYRNEVQVGSIDVSTTSTSYNTSSTSGLIGVDSNTLGFKTNSAERMRIDSSGNTNFYKDVIVENVLPTIILKSIDNTAVAEDIVSSIDFYAGDVSSAGTAVNAKILSYATDAFGRLGLQFLTGGGGAPTEAMRIDSAGTVSISDGGDLFFDLATVSNAKIGRTDRSFVQIERNDFDGEISFHTTTSGAAGIGERMRIDDSGNVGIGTSSPNSRLEISGTTGSYNSGIGFAPTGTGARLYRTFIGTDGSFRFDDATAGATRLMINSAGNVGIGVSPTTSQTKALHIGSDTGSAEVHITSTTGSGVADGLSLIQSGVSSYLFNRENGAVIFGANNTERMRILSSGGITFNGDTSSSNALNDYEEGTWTPTFGNGTTFVAVAHSSSVYTKIGNKVTVTSRTLNYDTSSFASGDNVHIGGLPYVSAPHSYGSIFLRSTVSGDVVRAINVVPSSTVFGILGTTMADINSLATDGWFTITYFV